MDEARTCALQTNYHPYLEHQIPPQVGIAGGQGITAALHAYSYFRQPYYKK